MNGSMSTLGRQLIGCGSILTSVLLFGCGGGGSDTPPSIAQQPPSEAIVTGAQLVRSLGKTALVGQPYRSNVVVVPSDRRNSVVALAVTNPTAGGASPTIDVSGAVVWTPNETDFASTLELTITATLREGAAATLVSPVSVRKERLIHEEQLPAAAGTIADPNGRYLIQVEPETAGASMSGTLSISEVFSANGSFVFVVRVPVASGARVTMLDAPETLDAAPSTGAIGSREGATVTSGRVRPMGVSKAASGLIADVGGQIGPSFLRGDMGRKADVGEVQVYTTRGARFEYARSVGGDRETWSAEAADIFQIDANCTSAATCAAIKSTDAGAVTRGPVILIHGFNLDQSVGGGGDTFGSLANALAAHGHPVFELRWNTYMRFEEAAGVLSRLSKRVAEITGHRVTVVAHSFGGVVAHLSMMGQGIRYQGGAWNRIPVDGMFQRLITLGSPLSGIRKVRAEPYGLIAGRDDDDDSITWCESITCFQAGSSDQWGPDEIGELTEKVAAIDPSRIGLSDRREGETIRALHAAWQSGSGHRVPFSTVVSLKKRPVDYETALTNTTAFNLGDGLISIMGQAVLPTDFSAHPFELPEQYDILGTLGIDFLTQLNVRFVSPMETRTRDGREYFFALRAAHSCAQRGGAIEECVIGRVDTDYNYLIANYSANGSTSGRVAVSGLPEANHPLRFFIESTAHLDEPRSAYGGATEAPVAVVRGSLVRDGLPLVGAKVSFEIEDAITGVVVSDTEVEISSGSTAEVVFDAGQVLAARFPGRLLNLVDFNVLVRAGTGLSTARVFLRQGLANEVALGAIDLTLARADVLVGAEGRVIDGQTESQAIPGVQLFLMKGLHQSQALLQAVANTTTSRRVMTDGAGNFVVNGLQPGNYSVLAVKPGFVSQTQGVVSIGPQGITLGLSFSLLKVLAGNQATITLRWRADNGDARISSDLDAHLFKSNSAGGLEYWIYYATPNGTGGDRLDRDDRTYQGPETISLTMDGSARYVYWVGKFSAGASTLGASQPSVSVRIGGTVREFALPIGLVTSKIYWLVFQIVNGVVVPCDVGCLQDGSGDPLPPK